MSRIALIALLVAAPLAQAETTESSCKRALAELALAAKTAEAATDAADAALTAFDDATSKLDACRKGRDGRSACTKLAEKLKQAELALELAEEELTLALEEVDAAYDEFDVACSWEEESQGALVKSSHRRPQWRTVARARLTATNTSVTGGR